MKVRPRKLLKSAPGRGRWRTSQALGVALVLSALFGLAAWADPRDPATGNWGAGEFSASPSRRSVDQREWAASLVEALGLKGALAEDHSAEDVYGLLCPDGVERRVQAGGRRVPARSPFQVRVKAPRTRDDEPLRMVLDLPASALYTLRVEGEGGVRFAVDRKDAGSTDPSALGMDLAPELLPLREGPHELEARTAPGARIDALELDAFRPLCIAPAGGWGGSGPLSFGSKARTMVRAFGLEGRLPAAGEPRLFEGERYDAADATARRTNRPVSDAASGEEWAAAEGGPGEVAWRIQLDEPGLFSVVARIHGDKPQIWTVDERYSVRVTPPEEASGFGWAEAVTLPLDAGEHVVRARMADGCGVDAFQLVERSSRDEDYLGLLDSLGFREGAPAELVSADAAASNLAHPSFRTLTADLLRRTGRYPGDGIALLVDELDRLYRRPLSPVLPGDLP